MSTKSFDFFNSVHAEKKPLQRRQTSQKTESEGNNIAEGTVAAYVPSRIAAACSQTTNFA